MILSSIFFTAEINADSGSRRVAGSWAQSFLTSLPESPLVFAISHGFSVNTILPPTMVITT
jgi:hypothetical protein